MKYAILAILLAPLYAQADSLSCGDPDKGYYLEFPNYSSNAQLGVYEVVVFKNGTRKSDDAGMLEPHSQKISTKVDGYSLSFKNSFERTHDIFFEKSGAKPVSLKCAPSGTESAQAKSVASRHGVN